MCNVDCTDSALLLQNCTDVCNVDCAGSALLLQNCTDICAMLTVQVVLYYKTALTCATLTAGWEKDASKCMNIIKLARQLIDGRLFFLCCWFRHSFISLLFCIVVAVRSFSALTLLFGWQEGHLACKKYYHYSVPGSPWQHGGSSRQSAATSEIVKRFWIRLWLM